MKILINKSVNSGSLFSRSLMTCFFAMFMFMPSCDSDKLEDGALYTFVGETVASFCAERTGFSTFYQIIEESGNLSLLSCYGHFTCFAPTDSAFNEYFKEKNISYGDLSINDKKNIVYNHIIKGENKEYFTKDFQEGALPIPTMNDRFITISYKGFIEGSQLILVNEFSPILNKDNQVHNGAVHVVGKVIEPSGALLSSVLKEQSYYSLFSQAFELTNLGDSIVKIYDETYINPFNGPTTIIGWWEFKVPETKKYGFTIFAETDDTFKKSGIENIEQLIEFAKQYYGSEDLDDFTSRNNPLNKFISYHMLDRSMATNSLLYAGACTSKGADRYEYYETMLQHRLMEVKSGVNEIQINTLSNGSFVGINNLLSNQNRVNGYVHALNNVLVYDENNMQNDVLNKHIRFDCYSIPPQLTNNNIRWQLLDNNHTIPPGYCDDYLKFDGSSSVKFWASETWTNYQADEMVFLGWYDFTLRMHPVPPGTYEIRLGYRAETWPGVAQLFIDDQIVGIPVDLRVVGTSPTVGWVNDDVTTDNGLENDKMMRNRGYMKAPNSIWSGRGFNLRQDNMSLRIIVGTFTFQDYAPHYFRVKNVEADNLEFHFDYLEYVPVSHIEKEGID